MNLAIMQPYFMAYIGYWQLMSAADRFVVYDDVNYIKSGWINRNRILINGVPKYITLPLHQASPYKRICDTTLDNSPLWRDKMLRMLELTYRRAPHFPQVFPLLEGIIRFDSVDLSRFLFHQLKTIADFLGIKTTIVESSRLYGNDALSGQERVLDICKYENAVTYINAIGGRDLYCRDAFESHGIELKFLKTEFVSYAQFGREFEPGLSIIDVMMFNDQNLIQNQLSRFQLI